MLSRNFLTFCLPLLKYQKPENKKERLHETAPSPEITEMLLDSNYEFKMSKKTN